MPGRNKSIAWSPEHEALVRECLEKWPVPVDVDRLMERSGPSLVTNTAMSLLRSYLTWYQQERGGVPEAYFETTPFADAVRWYKKLYADVTGPDGSKRLKELYRLETGQDVQP